MLPLLILTTDHGLSQLQGVAIEEILQGQRHVTYFPADQLPCDPNEMFAELFTRKQKWARSELLPYVQ